MAGIVTPGSKKDKRERPRKARPVKPSRKIQLAIRKEIYTSLEDIALDIEGVQEWLAGGATPTQAMKVMQDLTEKWRGIYGARAERVAKDWVAAVNVNSKAQFEKSIARALGVDYTTIFEDELVYNAAEFAVLEASNLIKTIPEEYFGKVQEAVMQNFQQLPLPEGRTLIEQIRHIYGVSQSRATVIARDQTSKINTALTQARNEEVGISEYIWRTAGDIRVVGTPGGLYPKGNRVHGNHYKRNGQTFRWDSPPEDGHPGFAINCRCIAESKIDIEALKFV